MNVIAGFFVHNMIAVYFFYGLAFFVMGLALLFVGRRDSQLRFAAAILPLAAFALLHAAHEWYEMFQQVTMLRSGGLLPSLPAELARLCLLVSSFVALFIFATLLLTNEATPAWRLWSPAAAMLLMWLLATALVAARFDLALPASLRVADNLARYGIGIPAALLGAWALMAQQKVFREHDMSQFGRDLVWAAAALLLYGVVGQLFVQETVLLPSRLLNSANFQAWFGIPVQLFRAIMAVALTFFLMRALRAFAIEETRRLQQANNAKLQARTEALQAERRTSQQMERLNDELRLAAHKLSLLLDLSNLLDEPLPLAGRLVGALERIVQSLPFSEAGMILLTTSVQAPTPPGKGGRPLLAAVTGFAEMQQDECSPEQPLAQSLGEQSIAQERPLCLHVDDKVLEFQLDTSPENHLCRRYASPTRAIALPLTASHRVIGCLVLARCPTVVYHLNPSEPALMAGIAQQLGLSVANALLQEQAQEREQLLGELLHQVVGAQEAERRRIARELHDATGQSLTAISLGLRGVENYLVQMEQADDPRVLIHQVKELRTFGQNALGELRNIISDLRPPQLDDLGLAAALRWYIRSYEGRRQINVRFQVEGEDLALPGEYRAVLFRIAQEALTNIAKHAEAENVEVTLQITPLQVQLDVRDDGQGFDTRLVREMQSERPAGWGLVGIRERAMLLGGRSIIDSAPGAGTHLQVTVPLPAAVNSALLVGGS